MDGQRTIKQDMPSFRRALPLWILAGVWVIALLVLSALSLSVAERLMDITYNLVPGRDAMTETGIPLERVLELGLPAAGYAVAAWLGWAAMRRSGYSRRASWLCSFAGAVLLATIAEMLKIAAIGRVPALAAWAAGGIGALAALLAVAVYYPLNRALPKLFNYEIISYVVAGVLTTVVNVVIFDVTYGGLGGLPAVATNVLATVIAWIGAVGFAFVVNKCIVFKSRGGSLWRELGLFLGARLLSLGVDMAGMLLLVNLLSVDELLSKIGMNVIVMIMNYVFSKLFIFRRASGGEPPEEEVGAPTTEQSRQSEE